MGDSSSNPPGRVVPPGDWRRRGLGRGVHAPGRPWLGVPDEPFLLVGVHGVDARRGGTRVDDHPMNGPAPSQIGRP